MDITVNYLLGFSMRRIAGLTPSSARTDTKDAPVIAGAARTITRTLRAITGSHEDGAALLHSRAPRGPPLKSCVSVLAHSPMPW